ncbi:hypothetical protein U1Q18_011101 [Sarracenia purpurea var. burkii]
MGFCEYGPIMTKKTTPFGHKIAKVALILGGEFRRAKRVEKPSQNPFPQFVVLAMARSFKRARYRTDALVAGSGQLLGFPDLDSQVVGFSSSDLAEL